MQKVVGSSPIIRLCQKPRYGGVFCVWAGLAPDALGALLGGLTAHWCPIGALDQCPQALGLELVETRPFGSGVVYLRHRRC